MPLRNLKNLESESTERLSDFGRRPENTIIRTTQVSTTEDYDYARQVQYDQHRLQHPWSAKK